MINLDAQFTYIAELDLLFNAPDIALNVGITSRI